MSETLITVMETPLIFFLLLLSATRKDAITFRQTILFDNPFCLYLFLQTQQRNTKLVTLARLLHDIKILFTVQIKKLVVNAKLLDSLEKSVQLFDTGDSSLFKTEFCQTTIPCTI